MKLVFKSPLNIDECIRRLSASIDTELYAPFTSSRFAGSRPVVGRISDNGKFRLHKRHWRNPLAPVFHGTLKTANSDTIITGHFGLFLSVKVMLAFSLAGVFLWEISCVGALIALSVIGIFWGSEWQRSPWDGVAPFLVLPIASAAVFIAIALLGRQLFKGDKRYLIEFLEETLNAEKISLEKAR